MSKLISLYPVPPLSDLLLLPEYIDQPYVTKAKDILQVLFTAWEDCASEEVRYWLVKSWLVNVYYGQLWVRFGKTGGIHPDRYIDLCLDYNLQFTAGNLLGYFSRTDFWCRKDSAPYISSGARVLIGSGGFPGKVVLNCKFHLPRDIIDKLNDLYGKVASLFYEVHGTNRRVRFPMFRKKKCYHLIAD